MRLHTSLMTLGFIALTGLGCDRLSIKMEQQPDKVVIHVETLGEYQTTVNRIQIVDVEAKTTIIDLISINQPSQIHKITLMPGTNVLSQCFPEADGFRPTQALVNGTFTMPKGKLYKVKMWGKSSSCAEVGFRF